MTAAQLLEALAAIDIDPVFLGHGMRLCYWCQHADGMGNQSHAEDCPWAALRKRHRKATQDALPPFVDLPSGSGVEWKPTDGPESGDSGDTT